MDAAHPRVATAAGLRLAVIVPTLDEEAVLGRLLDRLLPVGGGTDRPDELLISDGGSRDTTLDMARSRGARTIGAPRGRGPQLAAGAAATHSELLLFLHADALPAEGALTNLRRAFEDGSLRAGACRQSIAARGAFFRGVERCAGWRVRWLDSALGDSGLAVRRELYEAAGGYARLPLFEDLEFSRRLARHTRLHLLSEVELQVDPRRWQRGGRTRTTLRNWALQLAWHAGVDEQRLARHYRSPAAVRHQPKPPPTTA